MNGTEDPSALHHTPVGRLNLNSAEEPMPTKKKEVIGAVLKLVFDSRKIKPVGSQ